MKAKEDASDSGNDDLLDISGYLREKLSDREKSELLADSRATSAWVYGIIKKICEA